MRASARTGSFAARALLLAGRVLLVAGPLAVVACRATREMWVGSSLDASGTVPDHPIPMITLLIVLAWCLVWPALLLPVAALPLIDASEDGMSARTVLGTRRLQRPLRVGLWLRVLGGWTDQMLVLVRGEHGLPIVVAVWEGESGKDLESSIGPLKLGTGPLGHAPTPWRGVAAHYLVGLGLLVPYAFVFFALFAGAWAVAVG